MIKLRPWTDCVRSAPPSDDFIVEEILGELVGDIILGDADNDEYNRGFDDGRNGNASRGTSEHYRQGYSDGKEMGMG